MVVTNPFADRIRPAADRLALERLRIGFDRRRRTDRERRHRDIAQERPERMRQLEHDARRRRRLDVADDAGETAEHIGVIRIVEVAAVGIARQSPAIEVELHRCGVGRRPVGEDRFGPQGERPLGAGRVRAPLRRERRHDVERAGFEGHEIFHDLSGGVERDAVGLMRGIQTNGILDPRHDQRSRGAGARVPRAAAAAGDEKRGQRDGDQANKRTDHAVHFRAGDGSPSRTPRTPRAISDRRATLGPTGACG